MELHPELATNFQKSLYLALYDDFDPEHLKYVEKLQSNISDSDDVDFEDDNSESRPASRSTSVSTTAKSPATAAKPIFQYFPPVNMPQLKQIRERFIFQRNHERRRWLCVLRDAINAGENIELTQRVSRELEQLPNDVNFWDVS